jgi:hypothetical protein
LREAKRRSFHAGSTWSVTNCCLGVLCPVTSPGGARNALPLTPPQTITPTPQYLNTSKWCSFLADCCSILFVALQLCILTNPTKNKLQTNSSQKQRIRRIEKAQGRLVIIIIFIIFSWNYL